MLREAQQHGADPFGGAMTELVVIAHMLVSKDGLFDPTALDALVEILRNNERSIGRPDTATAGFCGPPSRRPRPPASTTAAYFCITPT